MAVLSNYNQLYHDIYTYNRPASSTASATPIGYSTTSQSFGRIDWSGCRARVRSFCTVAGSHYGMPFDRENVNWWNACVYGGIMVTPRHMIVCQHYRGKWSAPTVNTNGIVLLGKNGLRSTMRVEQVFLDIGGDQTLLQFDAPVPDPSVEIYDRIADCEFIPSGTPIWVQDSNGKCYRRVFTGVRRVDGVVVSWMSDPLRDGLNEGPYSGSPAVFTGDSGSPAFVMSSDGKTVPLGMMFGGALFTQATIDRINDIGRAFGYSVRFERLTAVPADLNQDGKVDAADLSVMMSEWGANPSFADLNRDGKVDAEDMAILLQTWGEYSMSPADYSDSTTVINPNPGTKTRS